MGSDHKIVDLVPRRASTERQIRELKGEVETLRGALERQRDGHADRTYGLGLGLLCFGVGFALGILFALAG